jgi:hypothetical protein
MRPPSPRPPFLVSRLGRLAWTCVDPSSQRLAISLTTNGLAEVGMLGRPVTLALGIVLVACLGATPASAAIDKLHGLQRTDARAADDARRVVARVVTKANKDVANVSEFEEADVKAYLSTDLHSYRGKPKRKFRGKAQGSPTPFSYAPFQRLLTPLLLFYQVPRLPNSRLRRPAASTTTLSPTPTPTPTPTPAPTAPWLWTSSWPESGANKTQRQGSFLRRCSRARGS